MRGRRKPKHKIVQSTDSIALENKILQYCQADIEPDKINEAIQKITELYQQAEEKKLDLTYQIMLESHKLCIFVMKKSDPDYKKSVIGSIQKINQLMKKQANKNLVEQWDVICSKMNKAIVMIVYHYIDDLNDPAFIYIINRQLGNVELDLVLHKPFNAKNILDVNYFFSQCFESMSNIINFLQYQYPDACQQAAVLLNFNQVIATCTEYGLLLRQYTLHLTQATQNPQHSISQESKTVIINEPKKTLNPNNSSRPIPKVNVQTSNSSVIKMEETVLESHYNLSIETLQNIVQNIENQLKKNITWKELVEEKQKTMQLLIIANQLLFTYLQKNVKSKNYIERLESLVSHQFQPGNNLKLSYLIQKFYLYDYSYRINLEIKTQPKQTAEQIYQNMKSILKNDENNEFKQDVGFCITYIWSALSYLFDCYSEKMYYSLREKTKSEQSDELCQRSYLLNHAKSKHTQSNSFSQKRNNTLSLMVMHNLITESNIVLENIGTSLDLLTEKPITENDIFHALCFLTVPNLLNAFLYLPTVELLKDKLEYLNNSTKIDFLQKLKKLNRQLAITLQIIKEVFPQFQTLISEDTLRHFTEETSKIENEIKSIKEKDKMELKSKWTTEGNKNITSSYREIKKLTASPIVKNEKVSTQNVFSEQSYQTKNNSTGTLVDSGINDPAQIKFLEKLNLAFQKLLESDYKKAKKYYASLTELNPEYELNALDGELECCAREILDQLQDFSKEVYYYVFNSQSGSFKTDQDKKKKCDQIKEKLPEMYSLYQEFKNKKITYLKKLKEKFLSNSHDLTESHYTCAINMANDRGALILKVYEDLKTRFEKFNSYESYVEVMEEGFKKKKMSNSKEKDHILEQGYKLKIYDIPTNNKEEKNQIETIYNAGEKEIELNNATKDMLEIFNDVDKHFPFLEEPSTKSVESTSQIKKHHSQGTGVSFFSPSQQDQHSVGEEATVIVTTTTTTTAITTTTTIVPLNVTTVVADTIIPVTSNTKTEVQKQIKEEAAADWELECHANMLQYPIEPQSTSAAKIQINNPYSFYSVDQIMRRAIIKEIQIAQKT